MVAIIDNKCDQILMAEKMFEFEKKKDGFHLNVCSILEHLSVFKECSKWDQIPSIISIKEHCYWYSRLWFTSWSQHKELSCHLLSSSLIAVNERTKKGGHRRGRHREEWLTENILLLFEHDMIIKSKNNRLFTFTAYHLNWNTSRMCISFAPPNLMSPIWWTLPPFPF